MTPLPTTLATKEGREAVICALSCFVFCANFCLVDHKTPHARLIASGRAVQHVRS